MVKYIFITLIFVGYNFCKNDVNQENQEQIYYGKVLSIDDVVENNYTMGDSQKNEYKEILFSAKLLSGEDKGKVVNGTQTIYSLYAGNAKNVEVGKQ